jgi:hypothetical protein
MKLHVLDRTGHTTMCSTETDIQAEFDKLVKSGYAMFVDDERVRSLNGVRPDAEVLALAPLVGG